ncbi:MAG TPA: translation initiation factor IF-1 [Verrucomicrobiae bacterium]|nr:translation initiation factor IF-1 [Verrucomicrobiae bacterium]
MAVKDAIEAEGRIVEVLASSLFRVELANGHRMVAHVTGKRRLAFERMSVGDSVKVRMSPYDLSKGSITE